MTDLVPSLTTLRIATRKSPLALWQAEFVKAELKKHYPQLNVELVTMTTQGDKILDTPLAKIGGKGLFVKELEQALLEKRADIAVHSMKDVPMHFPDGLKLAVICEREDPRDAFVSNHYENLAALPKGAKLGTSSLRRSCQIKALRPDLEIVSLRGNVNTRLRKLDEGEFDAIILAAAGLIRLEMAQRIRSFIAVAESLPAGGQGAVGIETRSDDPEVEALLAPLHHSDTAACVLAERAMNRKLEGGCQVPIGCYAELQGNQLWLRGLVGSLDGLSILRAEAYGDAQTPDELGEKIADELLQQGADRILADVYGKTS